MLWTFHAATLSVSWKVINFLTTRQPYWISSDVISLHLHACLISAMPMSGFERLLAFL